MGTTGAWRGLAEARWPSLLTAGATALVIAFLAACGGENGKTPTGPQGPPSVASVVVAPDSTSLPRAGSAQLTARVRDADGNPLTDRTVTWSSSEPELVSVSGVGLVTAGLSPGSAVITATSEGRSGSAVVVVDASPLDLSVVEAQLTQGVQDARGSIPMILQGNGVVVNVLLASDPPVTGATTLELRLLDGATGSVVHRDTVTVSGPLGGSPGYEAPSAQFLVPASVLRAGLRWEVVRDPEGALPDDDASDDRYPRSGTAELATVDVPTLKLRFLPIVLTSHGNARGDVTPGNLEAYLRVLLGALPLGRVEVEVGDPFYTSASFGSPPEGGDSGFWTQVLSELDAARVAVVSDAHWYGVVLPPSGFNYTDYGGWAYIPDAASDVGPGTRTALGVQVGWFFTESQARDLVAHELGHNFGRRHSPCGSPSSLDTAYPVAGGLIGRPGHDVLAWARGLATAAATIPASTGDVMGYCHPVWASSYTYEGILGFRASAAVAQPPVAEVLLVRGTIDPTGVHLDPAFRVDARPTPERRGSYRLEGLAADGGLLFTRAFEPAEIDHVPDRRSFGVAVPLPPGVEGRLATLRVVGPAGEATARRAPALAPGMPVAAPSVVRHASGLATVACRTPGARGVLVRGPGGGVLAVASEPVARVAAAAGATLRLTCSDGVHTDAFEVVVP